MIHYTQYTHDAEQRKQYKTDGNKLYYFVVRISHYNGRYSAIWKQEIDEIKDGYKTTTSMPFADYNGRTTLKDGRLSKVFLTKADTILENNMDKYFDLWTAEKYQELCNEIHADFNNMK